ncbi:MAG TPA: DUF3696 domain-containing protein [Gammaproteobacteria bacterium]|nr:DUF3696 domain-containing protein [Gammaproteobacteria bacterium]
MIKSLSIGNFKAFGVTQEVPIRPITLIFGPNSAGKSSIIHSLALAHEASRRGELDVFKTELGGSSIDLGGFRQYVFRRNSVNDIEFGWTLEASKLPRRLKELLGSTRTTTINATFGFPMDIDELFEKDSQGNLITNPFPTRPELISYELLGDDETIIRMSRRKGSVMAIDRLELGHPVIKHLISALLESYTFTLSPTEADFETISTVLNELVAALRSHGYIFLPRNIEIYDADESDEDSNGDDLERLLESEKQASLSTATDRRSQIERAVRLYMPRLLGELVGQLSKAIDGELGRLQYLGPLRSYPPRHVAFADTDDPNWRAGGGFAWDVLRRDKDVREAVNSWLNDKERLSTPYELIVEDLLPRSDLAEDYNQVIEDIEQEYADGEVDDLFGAIYDALDTSISGNSAVQEINLVDRRTNTKVSHRDVGIGISQVLPVLVAAYASRNSLIAIEQPEIHIHPALQAELGDVFIQSALGTTNNTLLLETHSEHLILRLLRRIRETAEGSLPDGHPGMMPDQIAVLYVQPSKDGSKVTEIPITEDGEFARKWPDGFFAERVKELM